jgi:hypothetical protein
MLAHLLGKPARDQVELLRTERALGLHVVLMVADLDHDAGVPDGSGDRE